MRSIFSFFLVFASLNMFGQTFKTSISNELELSDSVPVRLGDFYYGIANKTHSYFAYTFSMAKLKFSNTLIKYDQNLKIVKKFELANGERVYGPLQSFLQIFDNKLYLISSQYEESSTTKIHFDLTQIDLTSLELSDEPQTFEIEEKNFGFSKLLLNDFLSQRLFLKESPDKTKLLAFWCSFSGKKVMFKVFNNKLKPIRECSFDFPEMRSMKIISAVIDNQSNIYFTNSKRGNGNNLYITTRDDSLVTKSLGPKDVPVFETYILVSQNNKTLEVAGTYMDDNRLEGVFSQRLSIVNAELSPPVKYPFPTGLINLLRNDVRSYNKIRKAGTEPIYFHPFILRDGTLDLIGEFRDWLSSDKPPGFTFSGDIFNVRFTTDKAIFSRIPKLRRSTYTTLGDSFFPVVYKNEMLVFYSDSEDNINRDLEKSPERSKDLENLVFAVAIVSSDGTVTRKILFDQTHEKYLGIGEQIQAISDTQLLVPFRRIKSKGKLREEFKFATINIE